MTITKNVWKAAAFLLILCLVSAVMISGTYAKYTSEFSGQDTALVAKWDIVATGGGIGMDNTAKELHLFDHANFSHMTNTDVDPIIAPGVYGQFTLEFDNNSDVDAKVEFQIDTLGTADVPIMFSTDAAFSTSYASINTLVSDLNTTFAAIAADSDGTAPAAAQTVFWKWPYENGADGADTTLGTTSFTENRSTYGLIITATAIQVEPIAP